MKISWKVFFSTIIIFSITFSIGGYVLISSMFHSSLEREITIARDENKMLRYSFETAATTIPGGNGADIQNDLIASIAESIDDNTDAGSQYIRVSSSDHRSIYESGTLPNDKNLLNGVTEKNRGYAILRESGRAFIQTACTAKVGSGIVYLESFRDITSLFDEQQEQYGVYQRLMLLLMLMDGIFLYSISMWIAHPIKMLSNATRKIANGKYDNRVNINSKDEIGKLASDFNSMAENLEKKIYALEDAARKQEDFIGSFAHELKTPLTSIIGYADMLRSRKMSQEDNLTAANYIFQEGKRLETLSLKLMDLIVIQNQEFTLKKIRTSRLFNEIRGVMFPILEGTPITFEIAADEAEIMVEPDLIKTMIINLLDNAKKAITGKGTITLSGNRLKDGYVITVKDTGKGIPKAELPKITEEFYMVDKSRARANGGAGLGLAICARIVKLHNGRMAFESTPNVGTTVYVFLKGGQ
ncbi:ATP-binding protein [Caproiciproducens sp. R1]|uniref:HAMP domain-containing sensor histidine kinase n=1 Tax=Acutalibacteraceae TaxID=3082771 RepID=UPI002E0F3219